MSFGANLFPLKHGFLALYVKAASVSLDREDLVSFQSCSEPNNMRLVLPLSPSHSLTESLQDDDTKKRNPSSPLAQN